MLMMLKMIVGVSGGTGAAGCQERGSPLRSSRDGDSHQGPDSQQHWLLPRQEEEHDAYQYVTEVEHEVELVDSYRDRTRKRRTQYQERRTRQRWHLPVCGQRHWTLHLLLC